MSLSLKESQAQIKARIWQAVAQSDLDLAAVPRPTLDALIDLTSEAALMELDERMGESLGGQTNKGAADTLTGLGEEEVLWQGRPFLSLVTQYVITNERVRIIEGLLGKEREDIELVRIQDIDQKQAFRERLLNLGDIVIRSHDASHPVLELRNITDPQAVHEILRRAILDARQKHRLVYREEM
ncbi:MAG: PH domain-containing protein [Chloroflexota bacterium]